MGLTLEAEPLTLVYNLGGLATQNKAAGHVILLHTLPIIHSPHLRQGHTTVCCICNALGSMVWGSHHFSTGISAAWVITCIKRT